MADYHSPTVVQPNISAADLTPLERLILDLVFDASIDEDGVDYHSECGPGAVVTLSVDDLSIADEASSVQGASSMGKRISASLDRRHPLTIHNRRPRGVLERGRKGRQRSPRPFVRGRSIDRVTSSFDSAATPS
jgi:hypothetical protein